MCEKMSEKTKNSKRQLESPGTQSENKKPDQSERPELSISDRLKAIRMESGHENVSYIPELSQQAQGPRYKPASEFSYAGTWDKGNTDIVNLEILTINGEEFKGSYKRPEALYIWTNVLSQD